MCGFAYAAPTTTQSEANKHDRLLSLMFTINLLTPCESLISTGMEGPYVFRDTPVRPLSIAFEQDMRAFLKHERYELSLDLCGCRVLGSSVLQQASIYGHS